MDNTREALMAWAREALNEATCIDADERRYLLIQALKVVGQGGLRGNISDAWKRAGYTVKEIPDLYV